MEDTLKRLSKALTDSKVKAEKAALSELIVKIRKRMNPEGRKNKERILIAGQHHMSRSERELYCDLMSGKES